MVTVSVFGLVDEGLAYAASGFPSLLIDGLLTGVALVVVSDRVLGDVDLNGAAGTSREGGEGNDQGGQGAGGEEVRANGAGYDRDELAPEAEALAEGDLKNSSSSSAS